MKLYTRHHIIPQCNRDKFNVHNQDNVKPILDTLHIALHKMFEWSTPKKQIELLNSINSQVYSKEVMNIFKDLINIDEDEWYKEHLIK